jgi:hypothetical protein
VAIILTDLLLATETENVIDLPRTRGRLREEMEDEMTAEKT